MTNCRLCPLVAVVTVAFSLGCGNEQPEKSAPAVVAPPAAPLPQITPQDDKSLTPEEYVLLGMPAHGKVWHSRDMETVVRVLSKLEKDEPLKLPRLQSTKSGLVFARLIATENFRPYQDRKYPIDARFLSAVHHWNALHAAFGVYSSALRNGLAVRVEQFEIFGTQHDLAVVLFNLADEFRTTLRSTDPQYDTKLGIINKLSGNAQGMVTIGLDSLAEMLLSESLIDRILSRIEATYPSIVPRLSPESQATVLVRLREFESEPKFEFAKDRLRALREKLPTK